MSRNTNSIWRLIDWPLVAMYAVMVIFGWLNIYGASHDMDQTSIFQWSYFSGKQFVWIMTSLALIVAIMLIDSSVYQTLSVYFYVAMILLLVATALLATEVNGSRSWLQFGSIKIQPAEFSKLVTSLMLATVMSQYGFKLRGFKNYLMVCAVIFMPMAIIVLQKETGSALVYASFMLMMFREGLPAIIPFAFLVCIILFVVVIRFAPIPFWGVESASTGFVLAFALMLLIAYGMMLLYRPQKMPFKWLLITHLAIFALPTLVHFTGLFPINFVYVFLVANIATAIYCIVYLFRLRRSRLWLVVLFLVLGTAYCFSAQILFTKVLQDHQRSRIEVLLGMKDDPSGAGYNVTQAKIAIGSGGFLGKGFLKGTQTTLKFVPEQHTDFIFCTVGEEYGFVGTTLLTILYLAFLFRLIRLAESQRDNFSRIYGYCVAGIFFFHFMVNVGMVIGLMPVIGIPLPFFSYGGSALWSFTMLLFIFIRLDIAQKQRLF